MSAIEAEHHCIVFVLISGISTDLSGNGTNDKLEASERRAKERSQIVTAAAQAGDG